MNSPDHIAEIAYAKINLALHVRSRRADGYHALESLFVFAEDGDVLQARLRSDAVLTLEIDGPFAGGLAADENNLVMQAAHRLRGIIGYDVGADIRLTKNLPVASGIGGGSADAAATVRLLMRLWNAPIPQSQVVELALSLGSDVPACIASVTQLVRGRGEMLDEHAVEGIAGCPMLLVNPGVAVSTAPVFAGWDRIDRGALDADSLSSLIRSGRNDLEPPAIALAPVIADALAALQERSPLLARMSGSGATCFALLRDDVALSEAAAALRRMHPGWWIMETRIRTR